MRFLKTLFSILFSILKQSLCNHDFKVCEIPYISERGEEFVIYECKKCGYEVFPGKEVSFIEKLRNRYSCYSPHNKIIRDNYKINKTDNFINVSVPNYD